MREACHKHLRTIHPDKSGGIYSKDVAEAVSCSFGHGLGAGLVRMASKQHAGAASHGKQPGRARRGHSER